MLLRRFLPRTALLGTSLACLAACGAPGVSPTAAPGAATPNGAVPAAKSGTVYTCQSQAQLDCLVFVNGKVKHSLSKGLVQPEGLVTGADGLIYVADKGAKTILVYSAGFKKLQQTLRDGKNAPIDVAVYKDEVLAANATNATFFPKGATKPSATLTDSRITKASGVAFDASGNCYLSFSVKSTGHVDEFKGCKGKGVDLKISTESPYGIAFDGSGNLYYTTYLSAASSVYKCSGTTSCKLAFGGFHIAEYLNFGAKFTHLWVNDLGSYSTGAYLDEFDVASGKQIAKIGAQLSFFAPPTGVAPNPGAL